MGLRIGVGCKRDYLTTGKYYSNGKAIRLIKEIGYGEITYVKIKNEEEVGVKKTIQSQTMESWAKWPVFVDNFR